MRECQLCYELKNECPEGFIKDDRPLPWHGVDSIIDASRV